MSSAQLRIAAASGLIMLAGCAHTRAPSPQQRWERIARGLEVMAQCPERVWPGYSWAEHQLVFYDRTRKSARSWRTRAGDAQSGELAFAELPAAGVSGTFASAELAGAPALFVSLDDTARQSAERRAQGLAAEQLDAALAYAFHESFHEVAQPKWQAPSAPADGGAARPDPFPLAWRPRYLRLQLLRSLEAALRGEAELSAAAYWLARQRAEAPDESAALVQLEVHEGSARYVETISGWLAREGCASPEATLQQTAAREAGLSFPYAPRRAVESYSIGALASLLLRVRRSPDWQQRVASGASPVALLLDAVTPIAQPDDPQRAARVRAAIDATNQQLSAALAPFLAAARASDTLRVGLAGFSVVGSSDTLESVRWLELPGEPIVFPSFTASLRGAYGARAELRGAQPFFAATSPCGPGAPTLLIPAADLREHGGAFSVKLPEVEISNLQATRVERAGVPWLCAREAAQVEQRASAGGD